MADPKNPQQDNDKMPKPLVTQDQATPAADPHEGQGVSPSKDGEHSEKLSADEVIAKEKLEAENEEESAEKELEEHNARYKHIVLDHYQEQTARLKRFARRFFLIFLFCLLSSASLLSFCAWQIQNASLDGIKKQVEDHAKSTALLEGEIYAEILKSLRWAALEIRDNDDEEIAKVVRKISDVNGSSGGVIKPSGEFVYGEKIDPSAFKEIAAACNGGEGIDFYENQGLFAAVPVVIDDTVRYVLYVFIDKKTIAHLSPAITYKDMAVKVENTHGITVSTLNLDPKASEILEDPAVTEGFRTLKLTLSEHAVAATEVETEDGDELMIFQSFIPQTPFMLKGCVSKSALVPGVSKLFWLLLLSLVLIEILGFRFAYMLFKAYQVSDQSINRRYQVRLSAEVRRLSMESVVHRTEHQVQELLEVQNSIEEQKDPRALQKLKQKLGETAGGLQKTLHSILELTGIERGEFELNEHEYDLGKMLIKQGLIARKKAALRGLDFVFEVDPALPKIVYGDEERVAEIINHLLDNAAKYTADGQVKFNVSGDVKMESESMMLRVSISDTGKGIDESTRLRIFRELPLRELDPYKRLQGFGLSVCYNLLKIMGGFIDVQTVLGKGSTLTACVPQKIRSMRTVGPLVLPIKKKKPAVAQNASEALSESRARTQEPKASVSNAYLQQTASPSASVQGGSHGESQFVTPMDVRPKRGAGIELASEEHQAAQRDKTQKTEHKELTSDEIMREILDPEKGVKNFKDDFGAYQQSCALFCRTADERRVKLDEAYRSGDWRYYAMLTGSLKNSVRELGGSKLYRVAAELESAARIVGSNRSDYQKLKTQAQAFISARHKKCLEFYDEFVKTIHSSINI